ncbi:MAG: DNA cytosine methyltransferase, partial [Deltaproteobacteria bacterium]|nr:DNA cytosine methyltransferase [Deltaproteobacteria bacterium]
DDLFFDFLDLVEHVKPKIVVAENVKGMIVGNAKGYAREVLRRFDQLGYNVQLFLINGADCGLPQRRERVFFVAIKKTFNAKKLELSPHEKWITAEEAFSQVNNTQEELASSRADASNKAVQKYWPKTLPGESFAEAHRRETGKVRHFSWVKLDPKKPSITVLATWQLIFHWQEQRRLTLSEVRVLSSFPDDYDFDSEKIGGYMMGMSVPPYMMATVADAIRDQWLPCIGLG